jgi:hypothetical protein
MERTSKAVRVLFSTLSTSFVRTVALFVGLGACFVPAYQLLVYGRARQAWLRGRPMSGVSQLGAFSGTTRSTLWASSAPAGPKHHRYGGRSRRAWALGAGLGLLLTVAAPAWGGGLVNVQAAERGGEYHIRMERIVDADPELVRGVLTDYLHIYRLNPSIIQSATLPSPDGIDGVRVKTRVETRMAFLRVALVSVADVRELPSGDLQATVVPELSDFRYGSARWQIHPAGGGSRVVYEASMAPRRFIPPLIGTRIVLRKLISETAVTFARLERLAQARGHLAPATRMAEAIARAASDCSERG